MKPTRAPSASPLLTLCCLVGLALGAAACPAEDLEPGPTPVERDAAALDGRRDQDILVADAAPDGPPATRSPEGKPDACGCKADEVCVQVNDSSGLCRSKTPRLVCQKVTAACRAKLVPGQRHCRAMPECEGELCGAPFQCQINVPCGNETDAAAVHCYGP